MASLVSGLLHRPDTASGRPAVPSAPAHRGAGDKRPGENAGDCALTGTSICPLRFGALKVVYAPEKLCFLIRKKKKNHGSNDLG